MTLSEVLLWREIKGKRLGVRFSRQISIDTYIVDFYCKDLQLAIEVDGSIHLKQGQQTRDRYRQNRLESLGVRFVRYSTFDVKNNLNWVLEGIKKEVESVKPTPNPFWEGKV